MLSEAHFDVVVLDSWLAPAHTAHMLAAQGPISATSKNW